MFRFRLVKRRRVNAKKIKKLSSQDFSDCKSDAYDLAVSRLAYFNAFYNLPYKRISIKNTVTRWGSCSRLGNLNFNYRIATLPSDMSDYIIVHELCHIGEFNHSRDFWNLVARTIPDYSLLRAELKKKGMEV